MRESIASHYCGQTQPHDAHTWQTPPIYGQATVIGTYQCAGLTPTCEAGIAVVRSLATRENAAKIRKIGARGQKRHPDTKAMFEALADALLSLADPEPRDHECAYDTPGAGACEVCLTSAQDPEPRDEGGAE